MDGIYIACGILAVVCMINRWRTWIGFAIAVSVQFSHEMTEYHGVAGFFEMWFAWAIFGAIVLFFQRHPGVLAAFGLGFLIGYKGINPTKWIE